VKPWALRLRALVLAAVVAMTTGGLARANDPATATMLFNEGRRLAGEGRYADACPKFEESERLDPGIGTQFNLADCYEHTSRTASAWALFLDVASAAGGTGQVARETVARRRAGALEAKLSRLTINAPRGVEGLEVHRNGEAIGSMLWSSALPVDPGSYTIEATAPGKKTWSTIVSVGKGGGAVTVTVPALEDLPVASSAPAPVDAAPPPAPADDSAGPTARAIALGLGAGGVVAVGLGTYFGFRSIAKHSDYEKLCTGDVCQPAAGPLHDSAVSAGNASTVAFVVAGALLAGAGVLWVLSPPSHGQTGSVSVAPVVGSSLAGATLAGAW
jgi:serine/threonine-protein kinase